MQIFSTALIALTASCLFSSEVHAAPLTPMEKRISGTWRLLRSEQTLVDGSVRPNPVYGPNPVGYVIYDSTHHMCLFLTRSQQGETEPAPLGNGLNAYCGKWRIDEPSMTVFHETEMDLIPKRATLVRSPHFELHGDELSLFPPVDQPYVTRYVLIFKRVTT